MAAPSRAGMLGGTIGPQQLQPRNLKKFQFSTGELAVEQALPYIAIINNDSVAHTITAKGITSQEPDVLFPVPALGAISIPTLPFRSLSSDGGGTLTSLYAFYSDVLIQGPKPAAGSGFSPTTRQGPESPAGTTSTTVVMMGLGANFFFTPSSTGILQVNVSGRFQSDGGAGLANVATEMLGLYGTGTAPVNGAAQSGTQFGALFESEVDLTVSDVVRVNVPFTMQDVITGLTVKTAYWFDLGLANFGTAGSTATVFGVICTIQELAA